VDRAEKGPTFSLVRFVEHLVEG